MNFYNITLSDT